MRCSASRCRLRRAVAVGSAERDDGGAVGCHRGQQLGPPAERAAASERRLGGRVQVIERQRAVCLGRDERNSGVWTGLAAGGRCDPRTVSRGRTKILWPPRVTVVRSVLRPGTAQGRQCSARLGKCGTKQAPPDACSAQRARRLGCVPALNATSFVHPRLSSHFHSVVSLPSAG